MSTKKFLMNKNNNLLYNRGVYLYSYMHRLAAVRVLSNVVPAPLYSFNENNVK